MYYCLILIFVCSELFSPIVCQQNCLPLKCFSETYKYSKFDLICENLKSDQSNKNKCDLNEYIDILHKYHTVKIYFQPDSDLILDDVWILKFINFFNPVEFRSYQLHFNKVKGIKIDHPFKIETWSKFDIKVYNKVQFYNKYGNPIRKCDDYMNLTSKNGVLIKPLGQFDMLFENLGETCELAFRNANINKLTLYRLYDSYYKSNLVRFTKYSFKLTLNSNISMLEIVESYEIDLNYEIMNENIFEMTVFLIIDGELRSIQSDLFKSFKRLKHLYIKPSNFLRIVRSQGIDWIRGLNSDLDLDLDNSTELKHLISRIVTIVTNKRNNYIRDKLKFEDDVDFCLFKDFPFKQFILLSYFLTDNLSDNFSCTSIWMIINTNKLIKAVSLKEYNKNITTEIELKCKFKEMARKCNRTHFEIKNRHFNNLDMVIMAKFLSLIFENSMSSIGIITNLVIILVIVKKTNRQELKEKQYTYMAIHSASNIFICLIQLLSLMNECHLPVGLYCSSIRYYAWIQYIKIVLIEYFGFFFRIFSNLTFIAFSLNRLSLIGKDHNAFTKFVSDLNIKVFIIVSILLSGGFSVIKALRYETNLGDLNESTPILFTKLIIRINNPRLYMFKFIFNFISDVINYDLFVILNIVVDLILIKKLREVMKEKEEKFENQNEKLKEKINKEMNDSFWRIIRMVFLSSVTNILLKLPMTIASLNDLIILIETSSKSGFLFKTGVYYTEENSAFLEKSFCFGSRLCGLIQIFSTFFFSISLSTNLYFLLRFDKKFQTAYENFRGNYTRPSH